MSMTKLGNGIDRDVDVMSRDGDNTGNSKTNTNEMASSRPIPVTRVEPPKNMKLNVAPTVVKEDEVVHHHNTIHKVGPKPPVLETHEGSQVDKKTERKEVGMDTHNPLQTQQHSQMQPDLHHVHEQMKELTQYR